MSFQMCRLSLFLNYKEIVGNARTPEGSEYISALKNNWEMG
jgi:preprotein translocase subunit Sss1